MNKRMKITVIFIFTVISILLVACEPQERPDKIAQSGTSLDVYTMCDDNVVCYWHSGGYSGGLSCFKDIELANKYCEGRY